MKTFRAEQEVNHMKHKIAILCILALVTVSGCGKTISSGYVYDKQFTPGYETGYTYLMKVGTTYVPFHREAYVPDKWVLKIMNNIDGENVQDEIEVTEEEYNKISIS